MSGPIVRTGATPEFWKNWDQIFGKKTKSGQKGSAESSTPAPGKVSEKKKTAKSKKADASAAKKVTAAKPAKKPAGKPSKKK